MDSVLAWMSRYGYTGLFALLMLGIVGLPVPDETLLVFCGYLISKGRLHPAWTFISGFSGSACGITLSYLIGRTLGHSAVLRYGKYIRLDQSRLDHVHRWFQRIGEWLIAIGYFVPGVRHFTALVAGTSELEYQTFAAFAYSGAAVWVAAFLCLGYFVGENWHAALHLIQRYTLASVVCAALLVLISWWVRRRLVARSTDYTEGG